MMRHRLYTFLLALATAVPVALPSAAQSETYQPAPENLAARQAFSEKRFGIFLHWGLYSLFGQGEWYMTNQNINCREYAKAMQAFYPHNFNARAWVAAIKDAGAGYVCFTTRHHEGFSMWDTQVSGYNIMHAPFARDIVGELAAACHEAGVGLHLYYSHLDWTREDYPLGRTGRGTGRSGKADWPAYYAFMNAQLTELLTRYGRVDCIWFDGMWDHDRDSVPFDWHLQEQYALIHRLQPACLIGNNHHQTPLAGEDIQIFERDVPGENKAGYSGGQTVSRLPLETCETMNGMWGYKVKDLNYKSLADLIRLLARTAAKGANLLLNIGPQPDGCLPEAALERLRGMGQWLRENGGAIYRTEGQPYAAGGDSVVCTRTSDAVFLHVLSPKVTDLADLPDLLGGHRPRVATAYPSGRKLSLSRRGGKTVLSGLNVPADCPDYIIQLR